MGAAHQVMDPGEPPVAPLRLPGALGSTMG